jgi:hypothetical protein
MASVIRKSRDGESVQGPLDEWSDSVWWLRRDRSRKRRKYHGSVPWSKDRVRQFKDQLALMFVTKGVHPRTVADILGWSEHTVYRAVGRVPAEVEASDRALLDMA